MLSQRCSRVKCWDSGTGYVPIKASPPPPPYILAVRQSLYIPSGVSKGLSGTPAVAFLSNKARQVPDDGAHSQTSSSKFPRRAFSASQRNL